MEIRVKIPKETESKVEKKIIIPQIKYNENENRFYNENKEWMEIIFSTEFNRINIKFSGIPNSQILEILKTANWRYSSKLKLWYPHGMDAAVTSHNLAQQIQKCYYTNKQ